MGRDKHFVTSGDPMAFIEWTGKNQIGIPEVDEQHQKLFDILNRLHAAVSTGDEQGTIFGVLNELVDYTVYHFNTEEELFKKFNYPAMDEHVVEHNSLTKQAIDLQGQLRDGSATISFELLDFLYDWLMDHTTGLDMEFGNFIRTNKIAL